MAADIEPKPRFTTAPVIVALVVLPVLAALGWALVALARHPDNASDRVAAEALERAAPAVERELALEGQSLERLGILIARDPKFFAVLTLPRGDRARADFKEALESVLRDFQRDAETPIFAVTDDKGAMLGRAPQENAQRTDLAAGSAFLPSALAGRPAHGYLVERGNAYRVAAVPITAGGVVIGALCLGRDLEGDLLGRLGMATTADVVFTVDNEICASTLSPSPLRKVLAHRVAERSLAGLGREARERRGSTSPGGEVDVVTAGGARFLALSRPVQSPSLGGALGFILVRPLGTESSPLAAIRKDLLLAGGLGLLLALLSGTALTLGVRIARRRSEEAHRSQLDRLGEVGRDRGALMASASNEVLEPASTIKTIADLIEEGALGELAAPQRDGLLAVRRALEALTRVANDLSDISLLDRQELRLVLQAADLGSLIEKVAIQAIPLASDRRQTVSLSIEPDLLHPGVDPKSLSRAILNVALHAIRRSPDGGTVQIGARRTGSGVGIYIAESQGPPLEQLTDSAPPKPPGPDGLGLAAAVRIVEAHGGTIRVWSEVGSGATFAIDLPVARDGASGRIESLPLAS